MKDYYKVLGIKETASAEEIHTRWIALMQKLHPDHEVDGKGSEEKAKEVNEAYQVLKYSSSRMEYDFERNHQRSLRKKSIKKFILSFSGLTLILVLLILSFMFSKTPEDPGPLNVKPKAVSSQNELSSIPSDEFGPYINPKARGPQTAMEVKVKQEEKVISQQKGREVRVITKSPERKLDPSPEIVRPEASLKLPPVDRSEELSQSKSIEKSKSMGLSKPSKKIPTLHSSADLAPSVKVKDQIAEVKPPLLIATEEEVRNFFANYIERYNQKDIQGFLSLFSPKAIQNQRDELMMIRRIYENFFSQSEELQYKMEDTKIESYQNAVVVMARYEIDQRLKKGERRKIWKGRALWILGREDGVLKITSLNYQHDISP